MKKLLGIVVLSLALIKPNITLSDNLNKGELKLSEIDIKYFMEYIRGNSLNSPGEFIIAKDSSWANYSYCGSGAGNCRDAGLRKRILKMCESKSNTDCGVFAIGRKIVWKNGINQGGKQGKINSKWSDTEIRAKLTELGFMGETISTTTKKTEETKTTISSSGLTEELKELNDLYKEGVLTKEEFDKAKKKLLN